MNSIYVLVDPDTKECRYVGKTSSGTKDRLRRHIKDAKRTPGARKSCAWIASLLRRGLSPEIIEIEQTDEWQDAEKFWIAYFRYIGAKLTNMRDGGCGVAGSRSTDDVRIKLSEAARRQFSDPAARIAASRYASDAWKDEKFAKIMREKRRMTAARADFREKQSLARIEKWKDPEYRAKVMNGHANADHSGGALRMWQRPEYREAQRLARQRRYSNKQASR